MGRRQTLAEAKFGKRQEQRPDFAGLEWFIVKSNIKCEERAALSLHEAGFVPYLPKHMIEIVHHRTKKRIDKTFNLFRQYLFVGLPKQEANWFALRRCDGVEYALGIDGPTPIPSSEVEEFWGMEHDLEFDDTRAAKLKRKEIGRTKRETARMRFPRGSRIKGRLADVPFIAHVQSVNARGELEAMAEMFGRLTPICLDPETVEKIEAA